MIILDTNVVSEVMRPVPAEPVKEWVRSRLPHDLAIAAITVAEILRGIRRLPVGRRQPALHQRFDEFIELGFRERIQPFDLAAADAYASVVSGRFRAGSPIGTFDAMIAGIALSRNATVATRDTSGFEGCGVRLVNPWSAAA